MLTTPLLHINNAQACCSIYKIFFIEYRSPIYTTEAEAPLTADKTDGEGVRQTARTIITAAT